jgi:elongation factor Ts
MEITSTQIKELRDKTGISVMQCKKALEEAGGDMDKALIILKKKRSEAADKKSDRVLAAGTVGVYVHNTNEVAAMVMLSCETDFVAKNEEFVALAKDIAMHVAAQNPKFISRTEVDENALTKAKEVFSAEVADKPAEMQEKILEGKLSSYFKEQILLEQPFIKNGDTTISELINGAVQKFGENVNITEMSRLSVKQ